MNYSSFNRRSPKTPSKKGKIFSNLLSFVVINSKNKKSQNKKATFTRGRSFKTQNKITKAFNTKNIYKTIIKISIISLSLFFIIFVSWFFLGSSFFKIKYLNINIENKKYIDPIKKVIESQKVQRKIFWNQDNLFLFSEKEFISNIDSTFNKFLYDTNVKKSFPNKLYISLKERSPKIVFITSRSKFYFDDIGNMIYKNQITPVVTPIKTDSTNKADDNKIEVDVDSLIEDIKNNDKDKIFRDYNFPEVYLDEDIDLKDDGINNKYINFILNTSSKLKNKNIDVKKMRIETIADSKLIVTTGVGYDIYFNMEKEIDQQIEYLTVVIREKIKDNIKNIKYIDLRFDSKIFYK